MCLMGIDDLPVKENDMVGDTSLSETCQVGSGRSRRRRFGVDERGQTRIAPVMKMGTGSGGNRMPCLVLFAKLNCDIKLSNHNSVLVKAVTIPLFYCLISLLSAVFF